MEQKFHLIEIVFKNCLQKMIFNLNILKILKKGDDLYKRLSKSQKQISELINNYDKSVKKLKIIIFKFAEEKIKDKYGEYNYNFKIIEYENYKTKSENKMISTIEDGFSIWRNERKKD